MYPNEVNVICYIAYMSEVLIPRSSLCGGCSLGTGACSCVGRRMQWWQGSLAGFTKQVSIWAAASKIYNMHLSMQQQFLNILVDPRTAHIHDFYTLCRGERLSHSCTPTVAQCHLTSNQQPYLMLAPLRYSESVQVAFWAFITVTLCRVETLCEEQGLTIFHDIISPEEIRYMKSADDNQHMGQSSIMLCKTLTSVYNNSMTTWFVPQLTINLIRKAPNSISLWPVKLSF